MKLKQSMHAMFAVGTMIFAGVAFAGPPVTITFKNLSTNVSTTASYVVTNANETSTYNNATPKPATTVAGNGGSDIYKVQNIINPNANTAVVRYTIGSKTCVFATSYLTSLGGVPQWNKSGTPSGGATCTATTTGINAGDNSWSVEFTMK